MGSRWMQEMDPAMKRAATNGDVEFLKRAFLEQPSDYFQALATDDEWKGANIFHIAVRHGQVEFLREAQRILPIDIQKQLFYAHEDSFQTPFHYVGTKSKASHSLVQVMKQMYASWEDDKELERPWLVLTSDGRTPLHLILEFSKENEQCALEILLMDPDFKSCTIVDIRNKTPLNTALMYGFNLVAEKILMSPLPFDSIFCSKGGAKPFTYATDCSDNVVKLLFKKAWHWIEKIDDENGFSMIHKWAEKGEARPCKLLLEQDDCADVRTKVFKDLIFRKEKQRSDTPLHIAARKKDSEIGQILVRGYKKVLNVGEGENQVECPPWKIENIHGETPLYCALTSKHEELVLEILSVDPTVCKFSNNKGESPFLLSVEFGCERVIAEILRISEPSYHMLRRNDGITVVHCLAHCPEETGKKVLQKYWWIINLTDDKGKTPLECAKQADALWLVTLLTNPSLIEKQDFDWIESCKRGETPSVLAFVENCPDLQKVCREKNDTPLHHIQLSTYGECLNFLKTPSVAELKNVTDHDGATPLHRALERKDMLLAQALLVDDKVDRIITDRKGTTAMDLLAKICKKNKDWEKMCKLIKLNPYLKTSYIQSGSDLEQIRTTLSVVAALLATITFAAGFTLPGGINSDTGQALFAKKAGFLVFLLADVYAMCTAMLVLFCLIWSMVSEPDVALLLVDRSVFILMQSLYGTLLAFVTGIYVVIPHNSLWIAIVIFVMCSIIGIFANRAILDKMIDKLISVANRDKQYLTQSNEEEMEIIIQNEEARPI